MKPAIRSSLFVLGLWLLSTLPAEAAEPTVLRLLAYNIRHGEGTDRKLDMERTAKVITELKPDLVALQEVTRSPNAPGKLIRRRSWRK